MEATITLRGCGTLNWVDSNVTLRGHHVAFRVIGRQHNKIMHTMLLRNFCWSLESIRVLRSLELVFIVNHCMYVLVALCFDSLYRLLIFMNELEGCRF